MKIEVLENSEQYDVIDYPGGEMQVRLMDDTIAALKRTAMGRMEVDLVARIRSARDLMTTLHLTSAIRDVDKVLSVHLWLPYLPYGRADRRFVPGDCFGLEVFAGLVNAQQYTQVITYDVHSAVAKEVINGLQVIEPTDFIERALVDFALLTKSTTVIALMPDAGALKRYTIRNQLGCNVRDVTVKVLYASKIRDSATGKLTGFEVPKLDHPTVIIDDICDGGGTFMGIAAKATGEHGARLGLYTTHAIYSNGAVQKLGHYFDRLYCTDSYATHPQGDKLVQWPVRVHG